MRPVYSKLRWNIRAHSHSPSHHIDIEPFDVEWREQELGTNVVVIEIGREFPPDLENALRIFGLPAIPFLCIAVNCIGCKGPPERGMPVGGRIGRIDRAVARAITHEDTRESLLGAIVEAACYLINVVHAEEDVVSARDVGIEG